jgi:hypothetical protein
MAQIERTYPPKDKLFSRAMFAQTQERATKQPIERFLDPRNTVSREILARANVSPATTTGTGWAAEIASEGFLPFLASLSPYSAAARLIALAMPATLGTDTQAQYPIRAADPVAPSWVPENGAVPVPSDYLSTITIGPPKKMGAIIVSTRELLKRSDADAVFDQMLRENFSAGLDAAFFATTGTTDAAHAGLLYGVTPIAGYGGGDEVAIKTDLAALAVAVATGGSGKVNYAMSPARFAKLLVLAPTLAASLDIAPSAAIPDDRIVAADAASLIVSLDPQPEIVTGSEATVHMSSVPLPIVDDAGVAADPVRSTYQTATYATRILYDLAFAKRRADAVAYVDGAAW